MGCRLPPSRAANALSLRRNATQPAQLQWAATHSRADLRARRFVTRQTVDSERFRSLRWRGGQLIEWALMVANRVDHGVLELRVARLHGRRIVHGNVPRVTRKE